MTDEKKPEGLDSLLLVTLDALKTGYAEHREMVVYIHEQREKELKKLLHIHVVWLVAMLLFLVTGIMRWFQ